MDDLVTRLHDAKPPHHRKCLQAADEIERLQAELARVRKLGDAMVVDYGRAQHWMERAFADPDGLKNRLSVMDVFADQLERNRAALAAWNAEAGR